MSEHGVKIDLFRFELGLKNPTTANCPVEMCSWKLRYFVTDLVIHINDEHNWTFTQIAEWLDTLETPITLRNDSP